MTNLSIDLRLRPLRIAFVVRPDDSRRMERIFQINTCLWGGRFNPIIPYFKRIPTWWDRKPRHFESVKQIQNGYLNFFEPDVIVEAEKGLANGFGYNKERIIQLEDVLPRNDASHKDGVGLSVHDLYLNLYKKEFQFSRRHKHSIVNVKSKDKSLSTFTSCIFGGFPRNKGLQYFEKNYKDIFDPKSVDLDAIALHQLYKSRITSSLRIGSSNLDVNYSYDRDPALFVLDASQSRDLIDFWNLRSIRRNLLAIPIQWISDLSAFCKDYIVRNHRPLPGNQHGVMIQPTTMFSRSIPEDQIEKIYAAHIRVDRKDANCIQKWYPSFWRPTPDIMVRTTRPIIKAAAKSVDSQVDSEKPILTFEPLFPDFIGEYGNRHRVSNVVRFNNWGQSDQIATVFPCNFKEPSFPKYRLGREHLLSTTEGLVFFPEYKNLSERWELIHGTNAINAWINDQNITAMLSDSGRSAQQIIHTLGGFWGVGRIASEGVVRLLNEMTRKPLTRSMRCDEFRQKIQKATSKNIWKVKELDTLVNRKAVELGLELRCGKCGSWSWHSVDQLAYRMSCDLCLKEFDFPITRPSDSKHSRWAYRVIGPFALPDYARGGYASALSIRFFSEVIGKMDRSGVTWSAGQELTFQDGNKTETDFILWYQRKQFLSTDYPTEIVFGEAKSFGKEVFQDDHVRKAKMLSKAFPGSIVVFATMKEAEEFSKHEIKRLRHMAEWGREYDRERNNTRAPVIVLTGTELFASYSLDQAWKDKGGLRAKLIDPAYVSVRLDNLRLLADLTQQAYLQMPSYGTWLDRKWRKRRARKVKK